MKRAAIYLAVIIFSAFTIAAMLGQVDWQLSSWYNSSGYWQFPWGAYQRVYAWEFEYTVILICMVLIAIFSFLLGKIYCIK